MPGRSLRYNNRASARPGTDSAVCLPRPGRRTRRTILVGKSREKRGNTHPKTVVVVPVVRVVPVALTATAVLSLPPLFSEQLSKHNQFDYALRTTHDAVILSQPPSKRPISVTILAACWYWPGLSQCQRTASRR